jgi:hypothetical protein
VRSNASLLPDERQVSLGERLVGIGTLDFSDDAVRFDLWCPDGMARHDVSTLRFFVAPADEAAVTG